jgi:hypothetical protein
MTKSKSDRLAELEAKKDPFNWDFIKANLEIMEGMFGEKFRGRYLGDIIDLQPSHKIYAFWTTNQTKRDVERDQAFWGRMERFAEKNGYYINFEDVMAFICDKSYDPDEEMDEDELEEDEE